MMSRQPTLRSNHAMIAPVLERRESLVNGDVDSLTARACTLSRQMTAQHRTSPVMSPTAARDRQPPAGGAIPPAESSMGEGRQEKQLLETLGDMPSSLVQERLFANSPAGFIQEVRWVSFAYELKNFSEAVSALAQMMAAIVEKLPEPGNKRERPPDAESSPPRQSPPVAATGSAEVPNAGAALSKK
eukprot:jgi/Tetstr1/465601/TSEL_010248.t1